MKQKFYVRISPRGFTNCWICNDKEFVEVADKDSSRSDYIITDYYSAFEFYQKDSRRFEVFDTQQQLQQFYDKESTLYQGLAAQIVKVSQYTDFEIQP